MVVDLSIGRQAVVLQVSGHMLQVLSITEEQGCQIGDPEDQLEGSSEI